ncbi:MAG: methyltransferase [Candidatus Aminicenantes bacterium]|nr:methyltransferase [Candidatus Aminicenantes bacterium]
MQILPNSDSGNLVLRFLSPAFLLGFLATSFQVFLAREFSAHFYGNEMTFGFVLAAWLLWGGLGSILASKYPLPKRHFVRLYYAVLGISPFCFLALRFSRFLLGTLPGELTGMAPMLTFALILTFFINFPLGVIFVLNVGVDQGNIARVYLWESAGAAAGGLLVYLLLVPFLSNWRAVALLGSLAAVFVFFSFARKREKPALGIVLCLFLGLFLFDEPSQTIFWKPFTLVRSKDSLHGKLQVIRTGEQVTLYNNGLQAYSYPDQAAAEEAVHFACLQNPDAGRILLIGGGTGGSLQEILKYPRTAVDYVELDPEIIRLSREFLPQDGQAALADVRVHIFLEDGRHFLERARQKYDLVILNLPEPATAQINRFYTQEFFREVKDKLNPSGVFSFRVPSAENYVSPELREFLSTLYVTLKKVFAEAAVVPGDTNIFLASDSPLTLEVPDLARRIESLHLRTRFVTPKMLMERLNSIRVNRLKENIESGPGHINSDLAPICYFFNSVLWSTQFKSLESGVLAFLARIRLFWLMDVPLLLFVLGLILFRMKHKESSFFLVPLAVLGLTTIACEIMIIVWFQSLYGYVYQRMALLLTSFMAGLALGAWRGSKRKTARYAQVIFIQFCVLLLVLALRLSLAMAPPEIFFFAALLLLGLFGGDLFIVSNRLFIKNKAQTGLGYGWDLLGSFFGAVCLSSILIPLAGLPLLFQYLFLANSFCLLFLVLKPKTIA